MSATSAKKATRVVIVGGGFAGLNVAKQLGSKPGLEVVVVDRRNHHLFQPLLYQVAMAGLSPADIAAPIRSLLSEHRNVTVLKGEVERVDRERRTVIGTFGELAYDYLVIATGATDTYFGNDGWEVHAPSLKTLAQATEIRRRVLNAFEQAEASSDEQERKSLLTFVVVGGGPTGVELAGAIGEMSRRTLARDFRRVDPKQTRVVLVEAGQRILPSFSESLAQRATRDLEGLGVQVWTRSPVTDITDHCVVVGEETLRTRTVLWAAGVKASHLAMSVASCTAAGPDRQGRPTVQPDLSLAGTPEVFVAGDAAHCAGADGRPLPGVAPVAMQQGRYLGNLIVAELKGVQRKPFSYVDKGQMATIGRSRAVAESGGLRLAGFAAWLTWLTVHIYYLSTFRNRLLVLLQWAYSYGTFRRGARLIVDRVERTPGPSSGDCPRSNPGHAAPARGAPSRSDGSDAQRLGDRRSDGAVVQGSGDPVRDGAGHHSGPPSLH